MRSPKYLFHLLLYRKETTGIKKLEHLMDVLFRNGGNDISKYLKR